MSEGKKVLTGKADMYGGMIIDTRRDQSLATISDSDFDEILKGKMVWGGVLLLTYLVLVLFNTDNITCKTGLTS